MPLQRPLRYTANSDHGNRERSNNSRTCPAAKATPEPRIAAPIIINPPPGGITVGPYSQPGCSGIYIHFTSHSVAEGYIRNTSRRYLCSLSLEAEAIDLRLVIDTEEASSIDPVTLKS